MALFRHRSLFKAFSGLCGGVGGKSTSFFSSDRFNGFSVNFDVVTSHFVFLFYFSKHLYYISCDRISQ